MGGHAVREGRGAVREEIEYHGEGKAGQVTRQREREREIRFNPSNRTELN